MHNNWAIYHSPELFDDPDSFKPERYLDHPLGIKAELYDNISEVGKLKDLNFGCGRRVCPGLQLAKHSIVSPLLTV